MVSPPDAPPNSVDIDMDAGPQTPRPPRDLQHIARVALLKSGEREVREDTIPELSSSPRAAEFQQEGPRHGNSNSRRQQTTPGTPDTDDTLLPSSNNYTTINTSAAFAGVGAHSKAILDEKLEVLRALSKAFDKTAADFPTGHAHQFAKEHAESFIAQWTDTLTGTNNAYANKTIRKTTANRPAPCTENITYAGRLKDSIFAGSAKDPNDPLNAEDARQDN